MRGIFGGAGVDVEAAMGVGRNECRLRCYLAHASIDDGSEIRQEGRAAFERSGCLSVL
jgi:hypothetical protein